MIRVPSELYPLGNLLAYHDTPPQLLLFGERLLQREIQNLVLVLLTASPVSRWAYVE